MLLKRSRCTVSFPLIRMIFYYGQKRGKERTGKKGVKWGKGGERERESGKLQENWRDSYTQNPLSSLFSHLITIMTI